jgi:cell wall-associated NlpC family hydrolase
MRARAHVRTRIGVALIAVATAVVGSAPAKAVPPRPVTTTAAAAIPAKKTGKRHWGRHRWGGWHAAATARRRPSPVDIVLAKARAQLGKPYSYGGAGPNAFDCSGLTQFAWRAAGVSLPHNAAAQYGSMRRVAVKDLRPGDLVFSGGGIGHVGIYVGRGRMIHAPQSGDRVKISPLHGNTVGGGRPVPPKSDPTYPGRTSHLPAARRCR